MNNLTERLNKLKQRLNPIKSTVIVVGSTTETGNGSGKVTVNPPKSTKSAYELMMEAKNEAASKKSGYEQLKEKSSVNFSSLAQAFLKEFGVKEIVEDSILSDFKNKDPKSAVPANSAESKKEVEKAKEAVPEANKDEGIESFTQNFSLDYDAIRSKLTEVINNKKDWTEDELNQLNALVDKVTSKSVIDPIEISTAAEKLGIDLGDLVVNFADTPAKKVTKEDLENAENEAQLAEIKARKAMAEKTIREVMDELAKPEAKNFAEEESHENDDAIYNKFLKYLEAATTEKHFENFNHAAQDPGFANRFLEDKVALKDFEDGVGLDEDSDDYKKILELRKKFIAAVRETKKSYDKVQDDAIEAAKKGFVAKFDNFKNAKDNEKVTAIAYALLDKNLYSKEKKDIRELVIRLMKSNPAILAALKSNKEFMEEFTKLSKGDIKIENFSIDAGFSDKYLKPYGFEDAECVTNMIYDLGANEMGDLDELLDNDSTTIENDTIRVGGDLVYRGKILGVDAIGVEPFHGELDYFVHKSDVENLRKALEEFNAKMRKDFSSDEGIKSIKDILDKINGYSDTPDFDADLVIDDADKEIGSEFLKTYYKSVEDAKKELDKKIKDLNELKVTKKLGNNITSYVSIKLNKAKKDGKLSKEDKDLMGDKAIQTALKSKDRLNKTNLAKGLISGMEDPGKSFLLSIFDFLQARGEQKDAEAIVKQAKGTAENMQGMEMSEDDIELAEYKPVPKKEVLVPEVVEEQKDLPKDVVAEQVEVMRDLGGAIREIDPDKYDKAKKEVAGMYVEMAKLKAKKDLQEFKNALNEEKAKGIDNDFLGRLGKRLTKVGGALAGVGDYVSSKISGAVKTATESLGSIAKDIGTAFSNSAEGIKACGSAVKDSIEGVGKAGKDLLDGLGDATSDFTESVGEAIRTSKDLTPEQIAAETEKICKKKSADSAAKIDWAKAKEVLRNEKFLHKLSESVEKAKAKNEKKNLKRSDKLDEKEFKSLMKIANIEGKQAEVEAKSALKIAKKVAEANEEMKDDELEAKIYAELQNDKATKKNAKTLAKAAIKMCKQDAKADVKVNKAENKEKVAKAKEGKGTKSEGDKAEEVSGDKPQESKEDNESRLASFSVKKSGYGEVIESLWLS